MVITLIFDAPILSLITSFCSKHTLPQSRFRQILLAHQVGRSPPVSITNLWCQDGQETFWGASQHPTHGSAQILTLKMTRHFLFLAIEVGASASISKPTLSLKSTLKVNLKNPDETHLPLNRCPSSILRTSSAKAHTLVCEVKTRG